jgi:hypothetical protein
MSKSIRLPAPIHVRCGEPLITLEDAARYILGRGEAANQVKGWPLTLKLVGIAITTGRRDDVVAAAKQLETSLFMSYELDISPKKPPERSKRSHAERSTYRRRA